MRESPDGVEVIGKENECFNGEWPSALTVAHYGAQVSARIGFAEEGLAIVGDDGEEKSSTRGICPTIIGHWSIM